MMYWLTRDSFPFSAYELWEGQPKKASNKRYYGQDLALVIFQLRHFNETQISRLKPGEIRKVKSITIELEE